MRVSIGAAVLLVVALAACGSDDPSGPRVEAFTATNIPTQNSVNPFGRCAPAQTVSIQGTGSSSVGALTVQLSHCFDPLSANPLAFTEGEFTYTVASGESFHGSYTGAAIPAATPALVQISAQWTITGGTGSFAGATGGGTASGEANLQTGAGSVTLEGAITR